MIYIGLFAILCLLSKFLTDKKVHPILSTLLVGSILTAIVGLRASTVGTDTPSYIKIFSEAQVYDSFFETQGEEGYEYGYVLLMRLIGLYTDDAHLALLTVAVITIMPMVYTIFRFSDIPWFSLFLLLGIGIYGATMNILRQCIAVAFIFSALPLLKDKKIFNTLIYILMVVLATFFHKTALLAILLVPFAYIDIKNSYTITIIVLVLVMMLFFDDVLVIMGKIFPKYKRYFEGSYFDGTGRLASLFNLMVTLAMTVIMMGCARTNLIGSRIFGISKQRHMELTRSIYRYSHTRIKTESMLYEWALVIILCLQVVGMRANIIDRIVFYFSSSLVLYLPSLARRMPKKNKNLFIILIVLLLLAKFIIVQTLRPEWNEILPYKFYWQE